MKLLHIKGKYGESYIVIDKIEFFSICENKESYNIDVYVGGKPNPLAINVSKPQKIVQDLVTVIDIADNDIIEYTIKGEE